MPNEDGKITPEEMTKIYEYLNSFKHPAPTCEICGSQVWGVNEHIVKPFFFGTRMPPTSYPQFMVYCVRCRNTKYIGALGVPGLIPQPSQPLTPIPQAMPPIQLDPLAKTGTKNV
jgi:hypothetical protein